MNDARPDADRELIALSDLNLAESLREHARWVSAGRIDEHADTLRTMSSTRWAAGMFNAAMLLRRACGSLGDVVHWGTELPD